MTFVHEEDEQKNLIPRIIISIICFSFGFFWKPIFIIAFLLAGYDVIIDAIKNLFKKEVFDEKFLMSIATLGAIGIKEYPEAVMVMILYQIGEYLQERAIDKSKHSIKSLMDIRPDYANLNGEKVDPKNIVIGDIITVNPGERIPLDGIITEGSALVDESVLTGESVPVYTGAGSQVLSGSINLNGVLKIKITSSYKESTVNKILELIETSAEKKAKTENFITKFAKIYTPIVVLLAFIVTVGLPIFFDISLQSSLKRALTFLVISCPCALVISVPLSFFAGIGGASVQGVLIKGGNYLEQLSKTGTVVFDKTGTLTSGIFGIREVNSKNSEIIKYAAIAESASNHPIAKAIKTSYKAELPEVSEVKENAGLGVEVVCEGKHIKAGTAKFIGVEPINTMGTVIYVSVDGEYIGNVVLSDVIKTDSCNTIKTLHAMHIRTAMFTGDTKERAETLQNIIEVEVAYSELLPADKVSKLEEIMSQEFLPVAFVGDGVNDAPVIKRADIGIAMGGLGSDSAIEASDIVIMDDKPSKIITAIKIARKTMAIVKQNIVFAIGVKVVFLILGGFGLMTMWGAVFADVGVAMIAILNSLRAKSLKF